jgi:hypothetical protein
MVFVLAVVGYVGLLSAGTLLNSGVLKALSYAMAFGIFLTMCVVHAFLPKLKTAVPKFGLPLAVYYFGFVCSLMVNHDELAYSDLLKMFMGPAFLLFGTAFEARQDVVLWERLAVRQAFWLMALLPVLVWLVQLATGLASGGAGGGREMLMGGGGEVSIFSNRNNAALYAVSLLALYNVLSGRAVRNVALILATGVIFVTLGVLVALVVALALTVVKVRTLRYAVPVVLVVVLAMVLFPEAVVFKRIIPVIDSVKLLWSGRIRLATVSYGDLVLLLKTSDLSFLFRLKHWNNLLSLLADGSWYQWLFGFGVGSSVRLSQIHLVPHNDYLRYLFECGLITCIGFISTIVLIIRSCGRRWETVPLLTISLYFFSENLINNYLAMAIFYFCAGALTFRIGNRHVDTSIP